MRKWAPIYVLAAGLILLLSSCVVMFWLARSDDLAVRQQTFGQAAALDDLTAITMRWSAEHGHVFIERRDEGHKTLRTISPGAMAREFSQYASSSGVFGLHVASLSPWNPADAPDAWEKAALADFAKGVPERREVALKDGKPSYRLMRPLYAEHSCLTCHPGGGYKANDVLGGISVNVPFDSPILSRHRRERAIAVFLLSFLGVIIVSLYVIVWRLMKRLEELNEAKDTFLGMAAHDLRSPLTVSIASVSVLKESLEDKTHLEILDTIERSSVRMLGLVTALLDVASIENGRLELRPVNVDIAALLDESVRFYRILGRTIRVDIRGDIAPGIGGAFLDPERIRQAVDNLIGNSLKFSNAGTTITVGAKKEAGRLDIWVEDQAGGMAPETVNRIIEGPERRTGRRGSGRKDSHGLGLAIVKRMVKLHGGTFHITSQAGKGTKIILSFPLTAAA
jgi:signal transduction histidine kinase